jgi:hypothetical protein
MDGAGGLVLIAIVIVAFIVTGVLVRVINFCLQVRYGEYVPV